MQDGLPPADVPEFQAKAALRFYTSYASEGAGMIDLFGAEGRLLSAHLPAVLQCRRCQARSLSGRTRRPHNAGGPADDR